MAEHREMKLPRIGEAIVIDDLRLVCTCAVAPEQYDAFLGNEQVGYLRLRHGHFTGTYPDVDGELIYEADPKGDGCFEDDERAHFLMEAVRALKLHADAG